MEIGSKWGRWSVVAPAPPRIYLADGRVPHSHRFWLCRCECGTERDIVEGSLLRRASLSCGCLNRERTVEVHRTHGQSSTPEYRAWQAIKDRCLNPNNKRFADYGGRGIKVCAAWRDNFTEFLAEVGKRPTSRHTIERMNNSKGYEPGNVCWALPPRQMVNRRNTRFVDYEGRSVPLADLAKQFDVPANTLRARLLKGWPAGTALSEPVRHKEPNGAGRLRDRIGR